MKELNTKAKKLHDDKMKRLDKIKGKYLFILLLLIFIVNFKF